MIKVLIADDHSLIRDGIKSMLAGHDLIVVAGEVTNGQQVIDFPGLQDIDIILMDISMPVLNGVETTRLLAENSPATRVIALTIHEQNEFIRYMANAGAKGYILKDVEKAELIEAILTVYKGKKYFSDQALEKLTSDKENRTSLTEREKEILKLIAEELTNQQIAERLSLSSRTVDTHRRNIHQKLGIKNTAGLVKYAIHLGLI